MVAGRVGAAMSAEIGTMKVTQQIDALRALAVHPVDYLVVPRALAMLISMPLLVVECVSCGVLASYLVAVYVLNIEAVYFLNNMQKFTEASDIAMSLIKGFVFAHIIVFISCREGLNAKDGAVGVDAPRRNGRHLLVGHFDRKLLSDDVSQHPFPRRPAMSEAEPLIAVRDLVQKIGRQEILRGFSLEIFPGETLVLLGKSGGGKSVFLRHIIGLMKPLSGQILFEGRDISALDERQLAPVRRKIGMLFQDGALFDSLNVYDNVAFRCASTGKREDRA